MTQTRRIKLFDLAKVMQQDIRTLEKRSIKAARRTADMGRLIAYGEAPVAFGEIRDGLVSKDIPTGGRIRSTAPYSAAVEVGSRPHVPPLAPLIAWVRLRGMQGLAVKASGGVADGAAGHVADQIAARGDGTSTPVDAAKTVAILIQQKIKRYGTPPTWFMKNTWLQLPELLDAYMHSFFNESL
jgi:hypothetical protein